MDHLLFTDSLLTNADLYQCQEELQEGQRDMERARKRIASAEQRLLAFETLLGADRVREILGRCARLLAEQIAVDAEDALGTAEETDERPRTRLKEEMESAIKDFIRQAGPSKAAPIVKKLTDMETSATPRWSANYPYAILADMAKAGSLLREDGLYRLPPSSRPRVNLFGDLGEMANAPEVTVAELGYAVIGGARTDA